VALYHHGGCCWNQEKTSSSAGGYIDRRYGNVWHPDTDNAQSPQWITVNPRSRSLSLSLPLSHICLIEQATEVDSNRFVSTEGREYNIWYGKYLGDRPDKRAKPTYVSVVWYSACCIAYSMLMLCWITMSTAGPAVPPSSNARCNPETDSGETKADLMSSKQHQYICLHFARGKCVQGPNCTFYHRIPNEHDEKTLPLTSDIFGRERHAYVAPCIVHTKRCSMMGWLVY
jgi:hypothetical protein